MIQAALGGCQEAFAALMARYKEAMFGVAFHILGDFEAARDATQEAFIKAYFGLGTLRQRERFSYWLYRITKGTALNLARGLRRELPSPSLSDCFETGPTPQERVEQAELARQVNEALGALSPPTRLAVILHYTSGYSESEVADFLGTSPTALRARLSRARSRLREEMVKMMGDTLNKAAARISFSEQFLAGAIAAMRAFGPPTASRISDAKPDWTEMWVDQVRSQMKAHPNELFSWLLVVGQGTFSVFTGSLGFLSQIAERDYGRIASAALAFSSPERLRLAVRLARSPASLRALAREMSRGEKEVTEDIQRFEHLGLVVRNEQGNQQITALGAQVLCLLVHLDNAFAPVPRPPEE